MPDENSELHHLRDRLEEFILLPIPSFVVWCVLVSSFIWAPGSVLALVLYWKYNP